MEREVELVSSGYAWRCPECMRTEYENAVPLASTVRCPRCGASFAVARVSHRVEPGILDNDHPAIEAVIRVAHPSTEKPAPGAPRPAKAPTPKGM